MENRRCLHCMQLLSPGQTVCPACGHMYGSARSEDFALIPGTILRDQFLVGEMLGQGGFGITYLGFDLLLEQKVAIKEYFPLTSGMVNRKDRKTVVWSSTMMEKNGENKGFSSFLKEARKMVRVKNVPNVVGVNSMFLENETAYIVMDFIEGETLLNMLRQRGPIDFYNCLRLLEPIIRALGTIHRHGIIHRDISPDNIMMRPDGELVLLDLGAAKDLDFRHQDGLMVSSQLVAKHGFSPPEQYRKSGVIGPWTDVYAMAATIYNCCTGVVPPTAIDRLMDDELSCMPLLTMPQFQALAKCMAVRSQDRPQSMEEMLTILKQISSVPQWQQVYTAPIAPQLAETLLVDPAEVPSLAKTEPVVPPLPVTEPVSPSPEIPETPVEETIVVTPEVPESAVEEAVEETPKVPEPTVEEASEETSEVVEPPIEETVEETPGVIEPAIEEAVEETPEVPEPTVEEAVEETPEVPEPVAEEAVEETPEVPEPVAEETVDETPEVPEPVAEAAVDEPLEVSEPPEEEVIAKVPKEPEAPEEEAVAEVPVEPEPPVKETNDAPATTEATHSAPPKPAKKRRTAIWLVPLCAALVLAIVLVVVQVVIPAQRYSAAQAMLSAGDYEGAITTLAALGDYKDSPKLLFQAETAAAYAQAEALMAAGDYIAAADAYEALVKALLAAGDYASDATYGRAQALLAAGEYDAAAIAFESLAGYQDSDLLAEQARNGGTYVQADALLAAGDYEAAIATFESLGSYEDSPMRVRQTIYTWAKDVYLSLDELAPGQSRNEEAWKQCFALWGEITQRETIAAGSDGTVALKTDGSVVSTDHIGISGRNNAAVSASFKHRAAALTVNGTVTTGSFSFSPEEKREISQWRDIVAVSVGPEHTVGLRADGTVVAAGNNDNGQCDVSHWQDVVAVYTGTNQTLGLKADGSVIFSKFDTVIPGDYVACGNPSSHTPYLKSDGRVIILQGDGTVARLSDKWQDIVSVSACGGFIVGLRADGTVLTNGYASYSGHHDPNWQDIVAVSTSNWHTIGLKSDGTLVAMGNNEWGNCNVTTWKDIAIPKNPR